MFKNYWVDWKFKQFNHLYHDEITYLNTNQYKKWTSAYQNLLTAQNNYHQATQTVLGWFRSLLPFTAEYLERKKFRKQIRLIEDSLLGLIKESKDMVPCSPCAKLNSDPTKHHELDKFEQALKSAVKHRTELSIALTNLPQNKPSDEKDYWVNHLAKVFYRVFKEMIKNNDPALKELEKYFFETNQARLNWVFKTDKHMSHTIKALYTQLKNELRMNLEFKEEWQLSKGKTHYPQWYALVTIARSKDKQRNNHVNNLTEFENKQFFSHLENSSDQEILHFWNLNYFSRLVAGSCIPTHLQAEFLNLAITKANTIIEERNQNLILKGLLKKETFTPFTPIPTPVLSY